MLQAIETRYLGPTNHRGSRIVAQCQAGKVTVEWDHRLNAEENHTAAALALATRYGWDGAWYGGATRSGYTFVRCAPWDNGAAFTFEAAP